MTQQLMMMWGSQGQQVNVLGANGVLDAQLGVAAAGSVPVLRFDTIVRASSSRLVDFPLLTVPTGTIAYTGNADPNVPSVHAYWQRMTSPRFIPADNVTVLKPFGGASREVWVRLEGQSAFWQNMLGYVNFEVSPDGDDENFGDTGAPLETQLELYRRVGRGFNGGEIFVSTAGDDTIGNGTDENPFATIQHAIDFVAVSEAAITQTTVIRVGPGVFGSSFRLNPNVFVVGSGVDVTVVVAATGAGVLSTGFAGVGTFPAGISNCTVSDNLIINFASVGSTGAGSFVLNDVKVKGTLSAFGANVANKVQMVDVLHESTLTIQNISADLLAVSAGTLGGAWAFNATDAYSVSITVDGGGTLGAWAVTWTGADVAKVLSVTCYSPPLPSTGLTISGKGAIVDGQITVKKVLTDANQVVDWYNGAVGSIIAVLEGTNLFEMTPTAARTVAVGTPFANPTFVKFKNLGAFPITLTLSNPATGGGTWIPPNGTWEAYFNSTVWVVTNGAQKGSAVLVAGVSALIPADITATSSIVATLSVFNTATGTIAAKVADRVVGTRAGGGGFKLTSVNAAGATNVTDVSTYDWLVIQ